MRCPSTFHTAGSKNSDTTTPYKFQKKGTSFIRGTKNIIPYNATTLQLNKLKTSAKEMVRYNHMPEKTQVEDLLKDTYDEDFHCIECGALLDRNDRKCYRCGAFQD
jgi:hypothetical protein